MISRICYGNDFEMNITVYQPQYIDDSTHFIDFDLTKCTNIKVNLICEVHKIVIPLEWELKEGTNNVIHCNVIGKQLHIGAVYGIEITGLDEEQKAWRYKNADIFSVVDESKKTIMNEALMDEPLELRTEIGLAINAVPVEGHQGAQGNMGMQGTQGSRGEKGQDGTVSFEELTPEQKEELRGPQGSAGQQGTQGSRGEKGQDGTVSFDELTPEQKEELRGPQGNMGMQGQRGEQGERGIDGVQGSKGDQGERGIDGQQGHQGSQGTQGTMGMQGEKGDGFDLDPVQLNITDTPTGTQGFGLNLISKPITRNELSNLLAFDYEHEYFTITMLESGKIKMTGIEPSLQYSYDKEVWLNLVDHYVGDENYIVPSSTDIYFRATLNTGVKVECTGKYSVSGNIMSLLYGDDFIGKYTLLDQRLTHTFYNSNTLIYAHNLVLPAKTLSYACYYQMFFRCTNLLTVPELPATTLAESCYYGMFWGCSSLTTTPELPATRLDSGCYGFMFGGCTSLKATPVLPATILASYCYYSMFQDCTSLVQVSELPATTLADRCYKQMFAGCTSLTTVPSLPATTLVQECYNAMFIKCTNLNYIKCAATDISATNCTNNWVNGVSGSGTFVKNTNMSSWTTGDDGIPSGWTVESYTPAPAPVQPIYVETSTSGLKLEVVSALPATPDTNTIYIIQ